MLGVICNQCMAFSGYSIVIRQGHVHRRRPSYEVSACYQLIICAAMGTGNTDQESYCRINTDLLFNNAHRLASVCFPAQRRPAQQPRSSLPFRPQPSCRPRRPPAVGAAIESGFIVKMAIVTLSHNCFPPDKEILRIIQNHPWFFAVLTVAPFSGFVQVALAPISQKLCGAPAPIRIFAEIMGKYRLSHQILIVWVCRPNPPHQFPKLFIFGKDIAPAIHPFEPAFIKPETVGIPLRRHKCKPPVICRDDG